jgi:hypothetical protein
LELRLSEGLSQATRAGTSVDGAKQSGAKGRS